MAYLDLGPQQELKYERGQEGSQSFLAPGNIAGLGTCSLEMGCGTPQAGWGRWAWGQVLEWPLSVDNAPAGLAV
jgi:hypothetical protein